MPAGLPVPSRETVAGIVQVTSLEQEAHVDMDFTDLEYISSFHAVPAASAAGRIPSHSIQFPQHAN
jgi:hypothetical protein